MKVKAYMVLLLKIFSCILRCGLQLFKILNEYRDETKRGKSKYPKRTLGSEMWGTGTQNDLDT